MPEQNGAEQQPFSVPIDGKRYTLDDITYAERIELRDCVRSTTGNEKAEIVDVYDDMDIVPPFIWLIRRRDNPQYTLEQAQQITPAELFEEERKLDPPKGRARKAPASVS